MLFVLRQDTRVFAMDDEYDPMFITQNTFKKESETDSSSEEDVFETGLPPLGASKNEFDDLDVDDEDYLILSCERVSTHAISIEKLSLSPALIKQH